MPAYKTFASFAEKIASAIKHIEGDKPKQALTILKKLHERAVKKSEKGASKSKTGAKRELSPYILFGMENRARIVAANPGADNKQIMRLIAAEWAKSKDTWKPKKGAIKKSVAKKTGAKKAATKKTATKKTVKKVSKKAATKKTVKKVSKKAATKKTVKKTKTAAPVAFSYF